MATHSSILDFEIPWTEGPGDGDRFPGGCKELDTTKQLHSNFIISMSSYTDPTIMILPPLQGSAETPNFCIKMPNSLDSCSDMDVN